MYEAKRSGRDRLAFFGGSRRSQEGGRLALVRELRGAEMRGELAVAFQPVFELETGKLAAVEALLRWNSPALGDVPPAEFIPVAEDAGLIVPIGAWVLRESCETMARIAGELEDPVELSVNVSSHQLSHPGFRARRAADPGARPVPRGAPHAGAERDRAGAAPTASRPRTLRELESDGDPDRPGRLRHRRRVALLAQGASARRDQDRSQLRGRSRRGWPRSGDRLVADRPGPGARVRRHRGGGRDRGAAPRPAHARLRAGSGLPARPSDARGRAGRVGPRSLSGGYSAASSHQ